MANANIQQATASYGGMTKREHKRKKGSSTPGKLKSDNCHATGLKKGVIKYPRWYRVDPVLYTEINAQTDKASARKTLSGGTL